MPLPLRALFGFIAAAFAVLIFHQGMWALLHALDLPGLQMPRAYPMGGVAPFGVPRVLNLCFWGGLYGIVFGIAAPWLKGPMWLNGLALGIIASLVGMFVVAVIKGNPIGGGWVLTNWVRGFLINGAWGIGVGIIFPLLVPRSLARA
ncbi:hypothetical protein [Limobrevibacterium gyesilva]|nr:hypothetical protein [Limobrevibacterium gyesilva]